MGPASVWNRSGVGGKHHRHTRALLYCQCFRRGKKVDKGGSTKEKGARTLVVPELRALRHSGLDKGGGSGGGGILGPVASVGSLLGLPRVEKLSGPWRRGGHGRRWGSSPLMSLVLPPKGTLPILPTPSKGKAGREGRLQGRRENLKEIGQGRGQPSVFVAFCPPSSSLLSSRF